MNRSYLLLALFCVISLASCSSQKTVLPYFADIPPVADGTMEAGDYLSRIKPDDELLITVNALDPSAAAAFNLPAFNPGSDTNVLTQSANATPLTVMATSMQLQTFIVNSEGYINYPVLGSMPATCMLPSTG